MRHVVALFWGLALAALIAAAVPLPVSVSGCSSSPAPPAADTTKVVKAVATTVADGVCSVLEAESSSEWVALACAAEGAVSRVVVRMPRTQWYAIRARSLDAGPGK